MFKAHRLFFPAVIGLILQTSGVASANSGWFPFSPSAPVSAGSAVDASVLLLDYPGQDVSGVIDARGHLYAGKDGHFYFPGTGKRAKFFGTNFMVNTIFPPNPDAPQQAGEYSGIVPPDAADQLATRLARMGVNVVRLHFIDGGYARPVSIWDPAYPNDTRHFDPLQVRRLDYLIFALKRQGIYCDINLHAGRQFRAQDGVKDYNLFPETSFNKPATQFDPTMIRLQQEYAAQLLTHVNPYTNLRLADDPAIAFVEISNEDSMLYSFANNQLAGFADVASCLQGMSCGLPRSYSADLDRLWNAWLQNKYGSDAAMSAAWASPGGTANAPSGLMPAESLSAGTVKRETISQLNAFSPARNQDLYRFYYETEQSFFDGMNAYLRNTLGVKSMMTGTAVFGLPLNADLASRQDFVDEHLYPEYPYLTDTAGALTDWTIPNRSFSRSPGFLLFTWASLAVQGKPFTVTESDEEFPNDYAVEWLPWLTTFANFQDWDALMPKMYGNWPDDYFAEMPPGWAGNNFFALGGNPLASAQFPVASRIFLASQNTRAAQQLVLNANRTELFQSDPTFVTGQYFGAKGYADWQARVHAIRTSYGDAPSSQTAYPGNAPAIFTSDQGELTFDSSNPNAPIYRVNSPNLQAITGFVAGLTADLPNLSVSISAGTAPFGSITLQPVDGQPLLTSQRLLFSLVTRFEHTGMLWNSSRTSLGGHWGSAPTLVEPISGSYTLRLRPDSEFAVYALDARGNRVRQVGNGTGTVHLSLDTGADQTVWYEVVAEKTDAHLITDQPYYLVAKSSGLCLDVQGGSSAIADGVPVQQWACWGGDNQKWNVESFGQGTYRIVSRSSGKALDVTGGASSLDNGVPIQQWSFWGGTNQLWKLVPVGAEFEFVAASSGLCLDVSGGPASRENGVRLQQWGCWGGSNQIWQLIPAK